VTEAMAKSSEGDKASRMAMASAKFEAGEVLLPERAPWPADLEAELFAFSPRRHDQCDFISQPLLYKNTSFGSLLPPVEREVIFAKAGIPDRRASFSPYQASIDELQSGGGHRRQRMDRPREPVGNFTAPEPIAGGGIIC
jgi:hypothetical protein